MAIGITVTVKPEPGGKRVNIVVESEAYIGLHELVKALAHYMKMEIDQHGLKAEDFAIKPTDKVINLQHELVAELKADKKKLAEQLERADFYPPHNSIAQMIEAFQALHRLKTLEIEGGFVAAGTWEQAWLNASLALNGSTSRRVPPPAPKPPGETL